MSVLDSYGRFVTALACISLLVLNACSAGGSRHSLEAADHLCLAPPVDAALPDASGGPALGIDALLPAPSSLANAGMTSARQASALLKLPGSAMDNQIPPRNAVPSGQLGLFTPQFFDAQRQAQNLALALYKFSVAGETDKRQLRLRWAGKGLDVFCYVAIPDWTTNRWRIRSLENGGGFRLSPEEYSAAVHPVSENLYAALIIMGAFPWELSELELQTPPTHDILSVTPAECWPGETVTLQPMTDPPGHELLSFAWEFNGQTFNTDGTAGIEVQLSQPGDYEGRVGIGTLDSEDVFDFILRVRPLVAPELSGVALAGAGGLTVVSGNSGGMLAYNDGGPVASWFWSMDGASQPATASVAAPQFQWMEPGTYQCSVTAVNAVGADSLGFELIVVPQPLPQPVEVVSGMQPLYEGWPLSLSCVNTGGLPEEYLWEFGTSFDPPESSLAVPTVKPLQPGSFPCRVTLLNSSGMQSLDFVLVVEDLEAPQVMSVSPLSLVSGSAQVMEAELASPALSYAWNFGGAGTPNLSDQIFPELLPAAAGSYNCTLTVSNPAGSIVFPFVLTVAP